MTLSEDAAWQQHTAREDAVHFIVRLIPEISEEESQEPIERLTVLLLNAYYRGVEDGQGGWE